MPVIGTFAGASARGYGLGTTGKLIVSGGTLTSDTTYYYRTFTSNGTMTISGKALDYDYLMIAGGGSGAQSFTSGGYEYSGGGGGAGGLTSGSVTQGIGAVNMVIGAGGAVSTNGQQGGNTTISSITNFVNGGYGGGYGEFWFAITAGGGSGGGGGMLWTGSAWGTGRGSVTSKTGGTQQGNSGGDGSGNSHSGGGGGGAANGGNNPNSVFTQGAGGWGTSGYSDWGSATSTGHNVSGILYYAGGGGVEGATLSRGGGGNGSNAGLANTGGGGGGRNYFSATTQNGTSGGSGLVIIRYTKAQVD